GGFRYRGAAIRAGRCRLEVRSNRTDDGEASRKAGNGVPAYLTLRRSKKGRNNLVSTPFSVREVSQMVDPASARRPSLRRSAPHQCSQLGLKPGTASLIASSWYQLPLQTTSFTRGAFSIVGWA